MFFQLADLPAAEPELIDTILHWAARALEFAGIAAIVGGALISTIMFAVGFVRRTAFEEIFQQYRRNLGRAILLGLELFVGADIIGTVAIDPTFATVGVLGIIVIIRTFLSFSISVELEGRSVLRKVGGVVGTTGAVVTAALVGNWLGDRLRETLDQPTDYQLDFVHEQNDGSMMLAADPVITHLVPALAASMIARPRWAFALAGGVLASALIGDRLEEPLRRIMEGR
jgi:uncharacterized membrane protein